MSADGRRRRGRPPRLSREQVVATALELVDRRGVEGLTMRALARELGADPMSVYRHVRDKDDLLGALCDLVVADLSEPDPQAPWPQQVRGLAVELRARLTAHPALVPVLAGAPVTPASLALTQRVIAVLVDAGVPVALASAGFGVVFAYVLGFALVEAALPEPATDVAALQRAAIVHLGGDPDGPRPPHLDAATALVAEAGDFELGLDLLVDGLAARVSAQRPAAGPGA